MEIRRALKRAVDIPLIGIFGAMIALSSLIPVSIIIGGVGVFNLTWIMQNLTGVLLGPYIGGGAGVAGGVAGELVSPSMFGFLGFIRPSLGALQAALIVWGHWRLSTLILGSMILIWLALPPGFAVWPISLFYIIGFGIIALMGRSLSTMIVNPHGAKSLFVGWFLTAYCADITRHLFGNIWLATLSLPAEYFWYALPFTAIEQPMFALASALIGVPTLLAIKSAALDIPITRLENEHRNPESEVQPRPSTHNT